jgi:hypothetical protein
MGEHLVAYHVVAVDGSWSNGLGGMNTKFTNSVLK